MNRRELESKRRENYNKLDIAYRPKINNVEININNSIEHELAKFIACWLIRNGVPAHLVKEKIEERNINQITFPECIVHLVKIYGQKFKRDWQRPQFVTEARFKEGLMCQYCDDKNRKHFHENGLKQRRADIFIFDTGEIVEIETGKSYNKKGDVIAIKI